jgi:hypothetical protein
MNRLKEFLQQDLLEAHECFYKVNKNIENHFAYQQIEPFKRELEKLDNFFNYWNYHVKNLNK